MNISKQAWFGFAISLATPFVFLPLVLLIMSFAFSYDFSFFWHQFTTSSLYASKYLSLGSIPNLLWFYIFLNREAYSTARGIIMATLALVPFSIYVNFF